ncbi:zinc ribbon domain-containing protein [Metabacillus halosaccharovorans]|uniref:Zinc ribbon domain-containing protein n=1 Tax=Metabacillus halosaccharovorans TaxID=930124 RepID=A0ABT3DPD2_9BACI|nr:zinc ribbon domain-containing protein [Metabacillus halosaccharovorans]MCV9888462.1 zinc ribbon domain-containing protein [Metabacillus halosaccharovorans]
MFCTNCGANIAVKSANYCSNCGKKLEEQLHPSSYKKKKILVYITPFLSLLLVTSGLILTHTYESKVNATVLKFQEKAEKAALAGEYEKALSFLESGLSFRNTYDVMIKEKEIVESIIDLNQDLSDVEQKIMNEHFEDAQKDLNLIKRQVSTTSSPLFVKLSYEIDQVETSVKVGTMKEEINKLSTIDELADKLSTLYSMEVQEASEIKQQIYMKMVSISSSEAEKSLEQKHFNKAINSVEDALQYVVNNEKLLSLKDRIIEEKSAFEAAEQERINKAIQVAKKEEQMNSTQAVELVDVKANVDKYGDAYIKGSVKNKGTESVHSIVIEFRVLNDKGSVLEEGKTNIFPNKLQPGQSGNFEHVSYSTKEKVKVEVTNISWLLEEKKG